MVFGKFGVRFQDLSGSLMKFVKTGFHSRIPPGQDEGSLGAILI